MQMATLIFLRGLCGYVFLWVEVMWTTRNMAMPRNHVFTRRVHYDIHLKTSSFSKLARILQSNWSHNQSPLVSWYDVPSRKVWCWLIKGNSSYHKKNLMFDAHQPNLWHPQSNIQVSPRENLVNKLHECHTHTMQVLESSYYQNTNQCIIHISLYSNLWPANLCSIHYR